MIINHFYNLGIGAVIKTGFIAAKILKPKNPRNGNNYPFDNVYKMQPCCRPNRFQKLRVPVLQSMA